MTARSRYISQDAVSRLERLLGKAVGAGKPSRIMITGASGTLGFNVVRLLARQNPRARLTVLVREPRRELFSDLPNVLPREVCVSDSRDVHRVVAEEKPQAIIHCAASGVRPAETSWFEMIRLNVGATLDLFEASCELDDCHFVHVSTGMAYREQSRPLAETDPIDSIHPYGASKAAAESLLRSGAERLRRRLTVIRPFSFTGAHDGGDRLFPSLLRCAASGRPFEMSVGTQIRDFCAVSDVARAISLVLELPASERIEIYNIGSGVAAPLRRIVTEVCERLDLRVELRFGSVSSDRHDPQHLVADISKISGLGWRPQQSVASAVRDLAVASYPGILERSAELAYG